MSIHKGEFNSMLKKTGFLSQPKMEAKLIARHPERFLESYADRKIGVLSSENDSLSQFLERVKSAGQYERKAAILNKKHAECKSKAFLLTLASSPVLNTNTDVVRDLSHVAEDDEKKANYEELIQTYLTKIKMADKEDIEQWIASNPSMKDMKLPYGLPNNLRMPLDSTDIEDATIANFVEAANDEFLLLDGEYHTKLEELSKKLNQNFEKLSGNSKWNVAQSALLHYIVTHMEDNLNLEQELTWRLFPEKTREDMIQQKYLLKSKRALEEKRANIIRDWLRDKAELQSKTNSAWEQLHKSKLKKLEASLKIRAQKEICEEWAKLLSQLKQQKSEHLAKIQTMVEPLVKKQVEDQRIRAEKEKSRLERLKSEADSYRRKKLEQKLEEQERRAEAQKLTDRFKKTQLGINRNRIQFRQAVLEEKIKERKEHEVKEEIERQKRALLLEMMKEKPEIEYDPSNVLAETHATMVRNYEVQQSKRKQEDEEMVEFFRKRYSFAADTIWADRRVRVESKLRDAGLLSSSYARQVLQAMRPNEKPHLKTNISFDNE